MTLSETVFKLANVRAGHTVMFPYNQKDDPREFWTIRITDSLNNEQLKVATDLGGAMVNPGGIVMLIGEGF